MTYVLYVARDKRDPNKFCIGSSLCMHLAEFLPEEYVEIRNCDELRKNRPKNMPTWLVGSPTLVCTSGSDIFRGTHAVQHMESLTISYAQHKGSQQATAEKARPSPPASARRGDVRQVLPQPNVQLRPEQSHSADPPDSTFDDENGMPTGLWESRVPDADDEPGDSNRKITGDDLARAVSARQHVVKSLPQGPPPPPPPAERDV